MTPAEQTAYLEQLRQQRRDLEPAARLLHCSVRCGQPSVVHAGGVPEGIKNMLLAVEVYLNICRQRISDAGTALALAPA